MMHAPLPTMPEYDALDEHLDDLEVPGANLLQDFIMRAPEVSNDGTPLSISNGYTSEESDYSVTTPSDEQMYSDMSFLQSTDTHELVEVVADYVEDNDLTALSPQQQRVFADRSTAFAGKMIKGKTSKYRGVTQTSKTSWGAKYSAKRITNTCKTPDEAARAYDEYLKTNYPDKYAKFANFCVRCDRFVNPLGLPDFRNECTCDAASDGGSTEVESPPPASETDGEDADMVTHRVLMRGMSSDSIGVREGSNLSISSLKLSFLEDQIFDDMTMLPPQQSATGKPVAKRDSLTMATMESFSNDGNLDKIIKDIDRSSSFSKKPSFTHSNSFGNSGNAVVNSTATTVTDFSPEEWQNLSEYLLAEQDPTGLHIHGQTHPTNHSVQYHHPQQQQQQPYGGKSYKKIHSLEFDPIDHLDVHVKEEFASVMDVDDLAAAFMPHPQALPTPTPTPTPTLPAQTHSSVAFPARVSIATPFLEKYWRNDRKNIQCFPFCPEHGDYYRVRIENLQHRCKGVCRAAVKAQVTIPTNQLISPSGLLLFARCNSTFSRNEALSVQPLLNLTEIKNMQSLSAVGAVENFGVLPDGSGVQFDVTFYPDVWKFEFDLPKKRRHGAAGEPEVDVASSEFLYFFEIDIFYTADKNTFKRLGHAESMSFQIGNTRTLLRQRNRMAEEPGDDRVLNMDAMPEKKKVKMYKGQLGPRSSTLTSDDVDPALVSAHPGKQGLRRIESNDSEYDLEHGEDEWDEEGDEDRAADPTSYGRFVSPKNAKVPPADAVTVAAMVASGEKVARAAARDDAAVATKPTIESHSWAKVFAYSVVCIPMSIVLVPLGLLVLVSFLVLPPASGAIVRWLDALSDMELRRANSSAVSSDARYVLDRLDTGAGKGMFRFHGNGNVWSRILYFSCIKLVISVVVFVPTLLCSVLGLVTYPVRAVSQPLLRTATSMALVSREYTRKSVGKVYKSTENEGVRGEALV